MPRADDPAPLRASLKGPRRKSRRPLAVITYNTYPLTKATPPAGRRSAMTASTRLTPEQVVERNLRVVDEHFHNENPADIDKALDLYGDTIVWEVPARGVLLRNKDEVRAAYLK